MVAADIVPRFYPCFLTKSKIGICLDLGRSQPPVFIMVCLPRDYNL